MGYYSELAIELMETQTDRELIDEENIFEEEKPVTNQDLAIAQQEEQYSLWNEEYVKKITAQANDANQPKTYKKIRG